MDNQILKKIEDFISSNQSKKEYISTYWNEIIKLNLTNRSLKNILDEVKSSYFLEHYTLFNYTDNFIKNQNPKDKILLRKTLLSNLISNPFYY